MAGLEEIESCRTEHCAPLNPRLVPRTCEEWKNHQLLKCAIRLGKSGEAKRLVLEGVPVNVEKTSSGFDKVSPLHLAVHHGCLELIQALLDRGASVIARDLFWETPLILSVRLKRFSVTDLLLTADITEETRYSFWQINHLHIACMRNNMCAVKKLIFSGADVNKVVDDESSCWFGYTPLHFAVESHSVEIVKLLLDNGADMMKKNARSSTPLHLANEMRNEVIIDILLSAQVFQLGNPQNCHGLSHFHIACTRDNTDVVKYFLKQGVNVNSQVSMSMKSKWSEYEPLTFAIYYECPKVVEVLLSHGARLRVHEYERGCLQLAYEVGNEKIINLLLTHKVVRSKQFSVRKEMSKFQVACAENNVKTIENMLSQSQEIHPIELNLPLWNLSTPFHLLVKNLTKETIEILRKSGGNVTIRDARGQTPLHILFEQCSNIVNESVLIGLSDFERNPVDEFGLSHFHIICTTERVELISKFLENGADINCTVNGNSLKWPGYTPLHFAVKFKRPETVDTLLRSGATISPKNVDDLTSFDIAIMNLNCDHTSFEKAKSFKIVERMLLEGEKSCDFNKRGFSLLHVFCATQKEPDLVQLENYANMSPGDIDQTINFPRSKYHLCTPLHFAMRNLNGETVKWLIERGANIYLEDFNGFSPLHHEIRSKGSYGILKKNPELILDLENPVDTYGYSYFHLACLLDNRKMIEHYLHSGIDINSPRNRCNFHDHVETPLHFVLRSPSDDVVNTVKFLLDNGADVNARDSYLDTPLHCMEHYFNKELIKLFIDHGADINAVNIFDETPLCQACNSVGMSKKVLLLLEYGADINIQNDRGETPLTDNCDLFMDGGEIDDEVLLDLLKHAKKLMTLGSARFDVSEKNRLMYKTFFETVIPAVPLPYSFSNFNESVFEKQCLKEIEHLKNNRINQYTSLYSILSKSSNEMAYLSQNSLFQEKIDSNNFSCDYPLYSYLVKLQYRRGLVRKPLLEKSKKIICSLVGLSAEAAENILDYLDNNDLHNIIKSGQIRSIR